MCIHLSDYDRSKKVRNSVFLLNKCLVFQWLHCTVEKYIEILSKGNISIQRDQQDNFWLKMYKKYISYIEIKDENHCFIFVL